MGRRAAHALPGLALIASLLATPPITAGGISIRIGPGFQGHHHGGFHLGTGDEGGLHLGFGQHFGFDKPFGFDQHRLGHRHRHHFNNFSGHHGHRHHGFGKHRGRGKHSGSSVIIRNR